MATGGNPPVERRDVEINFSGQRFSGCNGLLLLANHLEGLKADMSELTEDMKTVKSEITEVNLGTKAIQDHLDTNGSGGPPAPRNLKRDAAYVGGGAVGGAGVLALLLELVKQLLGG